MFKLELTSFLLITLKQGWPKHCRRQKKAHPVFFMYPWKLLEIGMPGNRQHLTLKHTKLEEALHLKEFEASVVYPAVLKVKLALCHAYEFEIVDWYLFQGKINLTVKK